MSGENLKKNEKYFLKNHKALNYNKLCFVFNEKNFVTIQDREQRLLRYLEMIEIRTGSTERGI